MTDYVHKLVLGTAACQAEYAGKPGLRDTEASELVRLAARAGVRWFDTAPTYGNAERVLGTALTGHDVNIATKVAPDFAGPIDAASSVFQSVDRVLVGGDPGLAVLGMVQIHNATAETFWRAGGPFEALRRLKEAGAIRAVGATVYDEADALAAIQSGVDCVQVPFNVLDRRMARVVFPAARIAGTVVWVRSVWLRGALADPQAAVPIAIRQAADALRRRQICSWPRFAEIALRYVLGFPEVGGIVIGPRTVDELHAATRAAARGPLTWYRRALIESVPEPPRELVDPRAWAA